MKARHETLFAAACAAVLLLATAPGHAAGMKIASAKDNPLGHVPAAIVLTDVPGIPASATDVDIVITFRDQRGILREVRPTMFAAGCFVEAGGAAVDVNCPLIEAPQP